MLDTLIILGGFIIIAVSSDRIARLFQKINFPLITGLLFTGIICGPFVLGLVPEAARKELYFISDIALAYIAFAAGAELYLKELRDRFKSIKWITIGQLVVTFVLSGLLIYLLQDQIPFLQDLTDNQKIIVAILSGVIFIARSPASAIAIINEVRAKGPFTHTVLGVTVLKDFLVIILFALAMSLSIAIDTGESINFSSIAVVLLEMIVSFGLGYLLYLIIPLLIRLRIFPVGKKIILLFSGYSIYLLFYWLKDFTEAQFDKAFHIEPLLTCIIASFLVANYSRHRYEFIKLLNEIANPIYVAFFTLAGAVLALDVITTVWLAALVFFFIRLISIIAGAWVGGRIAGDPPVFNKVGWMPYITQAGVGLGLALIVARTFPSWGNEFVAIITAVIVVNQVLGPPLFKWALDIVGESRSKAVTPEFDGIRDAIIFGLESQSLALSKQLMANNWEVKLVTFEKDIENYKDTGIDIRQVDRLDMETLESLDIQLTEAVVFMLDDEQNLELAELIYQQVGTKEMVVRLNNRKYQGAFHELGALIVDPTTAIVSLLDHFVRSPQAASLLLGMQEGQDTMDLEVLNPNLHGIALRDLRLPADIIILSINRSGQVLITHGYTRLRLGDVITLVGSKESLKQLSLRFEHS